MPKLPLPALVLASSVALLGACSSPQHAATTPGTTPAIWTGSAAPAGAGASEGVPPASATGPSITTHLRAADGTQVATAAFAFNNGYATVTIVTTANGVLTPGFHGVHIHKVGKCEPNSVGPTGGAAGDFLSAGDHYQAPGHSSQPASGDLSVLQVRQDGSGTLVTTTDAFGMDDLMTGQKTAIIIHAGADNMPNGGMAGPGDMTMTPGDAGKRVACGVIGAG